MPVAETKPSTAARPCSWVSRSTSPSVQPACARAVRAVGSTHTPRISDRSIIRPPSQTARPAMLWPPPRTERRSGAGARSARACTTSAVPVQRAIRPGRRSIIAFQTCVLRRSPAIRCEHRAAEAGLERLRALRESGRTVVPSSPLQIMSHHQSKVSCAGCTLRRTGTSPESEATSPCAEFGEPDWRGQGRSATTQKRIGTNNQKRHSTRSSRSTRSRAPALLHDFRNLRVERS